MYVHFILINLLIVFIFSGISNEIRSSIDHKSVIVNQNAVDINSWNDINESYLPDSSSESI